PGLGRRPTARVEGDGATALLHRRQRRAARTVLGDDFSALGRRRVWTPLVRGLVFGPGGANHSVVGVGRGFLSPFASLGVHGPVSGPSQPGAGPLFSPQTDADYCPASSSFLQSLQSGLPPVPGTLLCGGISLPGPHLLLSW